MAGREEIRVMETITSKSIKHPVATSMFLFGFLLMGAISFFRIPLSLFPNTAYPGLTLQTEYFGVGPEKIEEILTKPLEESISKVGGIVQMFSTSEEGKSRIHIEFNRDADIDFKSMEIRDKADLVTGNFPREVQKPVLLRYDPEQRPVFIIVLKSSQRSIYELREIADREIKKMIEGIQGVSEVFVAGGKPREILVACDMNRLDTHSITMGDILSSLQKYNVNSSAGQIHQDGGKFPVYVKGRFQNLQEIRELIIFSGQGGKNVRLKDVSEFGSILAFFSLWILLSSFRKALVIIFTAASSTLICSFFLFLFGYDYNLLTITGMILSVGFCLNVSVLFLKSTENGNLTGGIDKVKGAIGAVIFVICAVFFPLIFSSSEMKIIYGGLAVVIIVTVTTTYIIHLTFIPIIDRWINVSVKNKKDISRKGAKTQRLPALEENEMSFRRLVSLSNHVRNTILQFICKGFWSRCACKNDKFPKKHNSPALSGFVRKNPARVETPDKREKAFTIGLLTWFGTSFIKSFPGVLASWREKSIFLYDALTNWIFQLFIYISKKTERSIFVYLLILFTGAIIYSKSKQEFINQLEEKELNGHVEFPSGTSFQITNSVTEKIEKNLSTLHGIKEVSSKIDSGQASIIVKLGNAIPDTEQFSKFLETKVGDIQPAFVYFSGGNDEGTLKEITIDVLGEEIGKLDEITKSLAKKAGTIDGVENVLLRYKPPRPEMRVVIDKLKSEEAGLSSGIIGQVVKFGIQGGVATKFYEENREIDIKIRYQESFRNNIERLKDYTLRNVKGNYIPLPEVASFKNEFAPVKIYRKNKKRLFSFTLRPKKMGLDEIMKRLSVIKNFPLPENYRIEYGEGLQKIIESQRSFFFILIFAFLLIFMVLASYFESVTKPFYVLVPLPFPVTCSLVVLFLAGIPISIPVYIGLLLLSGIVINQSLLQISDLEKRNSLEKKNGNEFTFDSHFIRRISLPFLLISVVLFFFYLPLCLVFGEGGGLLRGISIPILSGVLSSAISTPLLNLTIFRIKEDKVIREQWNYFIDILVFHSRSLLEEFVVKIKLYFTQWFGYAHQPGSKG
ncbi:MAG: efflux RND transporter permease subunit [Leptospira sp.]|nr:efflux RND transporter permease subunit [Leptospira sp.]